MASGAGDWSSSPIDDYETLISTTDVELLKRAWRNEKASPEILPFQDDLVKRAKEQIQLMEETVDEFEESGHDPLIVSLYQMDLDRAQFLLRSYLRVRLQKIEKFMFCIWKNDTYRDRLSEEEKSFIESCIRVIEKHLDETVLSKLPENYRDILKQSAISEEDDMVPEPQLDTFVVANCKRATRPLYLDSNRQSAVFDNRDDYFQMVPGDLCIIRYKPFREELINGNIDLV
ncbi:hypothetical protein SLA2020_152490 [Shorea laevis]